MPSVAPNKRPASRARCSSTSGSGLAAFLLLPLLAAGGDGAPPARQQHCSYFLHSGKHSIGLWQGRETLKNDAKPASEGCDARQGGFQLVQDDRGSKTGSLTSPTWMAVVGRAAEDSRRRGCRRRGEACGSPLIPAGGLYVQLRLRRGCRCRLKLPKVSQATSSHLCKC